MARILIVDDYEEWRRRVVLLLRARPEWEVVGEASDGLDAVRKVEELKPDLVLLDIGLPALNGIEVARRMRQISPDSRVVFLSQDNSPEAVRAALNTGACGYVHKAHAQRHLLAAVEAALRFERHISTGVDSCQLRDDVRDHRRHEIVFCSDDASLLDAFSRVVTDALNRGNAAIVLATEQHRDRLHQKLEQHGVDVRGAIQQGTYVPIDVAEALSAIMVDGLPDPARFFACIVGVIKAATRAIRSGQPRVVVCGEGVAVLQAEGKADAATRLGQLCDELAFRHKVDVLCAYACS